MNVYLIKASAPGPFKDYKKAMGAPPQNIFAVAAATPAGVGIGMCDETIGMKPKRRPEAEVVALFFHTPDAVHAYALADRYRQDGYRVVLGGLHPSFLPDEAAEHADALIIGEAEGVWAELLQDAEADTLKPRYQRDEPVDLATLAPYPTDIIKPSKYGYLWSVMVSRGCPNRCEFCTVPPFFRGKYRLRPIEHIVAEIKAAPEGCWFELHADELAANRKYTLELFQALEPLGINWFGEATIKLADDEELLSAAARSGCKSLLIGIETPSRLALADSGKGFVDPDTTRDKIRRFHAHGIQITSSMIFGFDGHTPDIFQESVDFCRHIEIDEVEAVILIPFPGTPLFERMEAEGRILTRDWSRYDGSQAVFQPKLMTAEQLEEGATWFWKEIARGQGRGRGRGGGAGARAASGPRLVSQSWQPRRWKSALAVLAILAGLWFEWPWLWGFLFLIWAATDLWNRSTYLLDDIPRSESPVLYWLVVGMWILSGVWILDAAFLGWLTRGWS